MSNESNTYSRHGVLLEILEAQIQAGQLNTSILSQALLPTVDLRTLLGEMTALKMDVRAQTQSTREAQEALEVSQRTHQEALAARDTEAESALKTLQSQLATSRRVAIEAAIDLIDRLDATIQGGRLSRPSGLRRWFAGPSAATIDALIDGMLMIRERALSQLEAQGVRRLQVLHQPFDPTVMTAVDTSTDPLVANGIVTTELLAGYLDHEHALRMARVIVNRRDSEDES